jgi:hypothetical protein
MARLLCVARNAAWGVIAAAVAVLAMTEFLSDWFPHSRSDWVAALAIVGGAVAAIIAFPRDGVGRALTWLASLTLTSFLIIYDLLDALFDPLTRPDWPVAVVAVLLVLSLESMLVILVFGE